MTKQTTVVVIGALRVNFLANTFIAAYQVLICINCSLANTFIAAYQVLIF